MNSGVGAPARVHAHPGQPTRPALEARAMDARGAVIEIVERRQSHMEPPGGDVVIPNEVRINGQPLLTSADHPVKVHQIELNGGSVVLVTLTLFARRIVVTSEEPDQETRAHDDHT